jgi:MoxR-like ATPase
VQSSLSPDIDKRLSDAAAMLASAKAEIGRVIYGQNSVVDNTLVTLMAGGHVLLIGVPGLAKTLLVETTAHVMGLTSVRIQCTPDLMPADVLGSEVLEEGDKGKRNFRFIEGPVFTQFLMVDEINRASPRTQSALLQAMQENHVSIAGKSHNLPRPFHVLATQNPIEQEGTYPLPEAQLDRFLMQIDVMYPDIESERQVLLVTTGNDKPAPKAVMDGDKLQSIQRLVRDMPVGDQVVDAILSLVRRARPGDDAPQMVNDFVDWAPGPRAAQSLMLAIRARALLDGRTAPSVDDVLALASPILKHRMALNYRARAEGITLGDIITAVSHDI